MAAVSVVRQCQYLILRASRGARRDRSAQVVVGTSTVCVRRWTDRAVLTFTPSNFTPLGWGLPRRRQRVSMQSSFFPDHMKKTEVLLRVKLCRSDI